MKKQQEDINPWAKKLAEATPPDISLSWKEMQLLLDREMPGVKKSGDRMRWFLLLILLLLLIGICNCPGIRTTGKLTEGNGIPQKSLSENPVAAANPKNKTTALDSADSFKNKVGNKPGAEVPKENNSAEKTAGDKATKTARGTLSPETSYQKETPVSKTVTGKMDTASFFYNSSQKQKNPKRKTRVKKPEESSIKESGLQTEKMGTKDSPDIPKTKKKSDPVIKDIPENPAQTEQSAQNNPNDKISNTIRLQTDSARPTPKMDSSKKQKKNAPEKKDKKADSVEDARGLLLALGLNQYFPVGSQEKSDFNSDGTSGGLGDYIPVPVIRYYQHKWLYFQIEAEFNTPQYTKTLLANQETSGGNVSGADTSKSVFIKKLFYFNLPLSVHYSPLKNLFLGAGLQYSVLTNGVALFQDARAGSTNTYVLPPNDTFFISAKVAGLKENPVYHELKTTEFRFLFDLNYQWKPITAGLRYNRAFTNFINVHVSNTILTQAHNTSLQLYLRYTLWDHRRKFLIPK